MQIIQLPEKSEPMPVGELIRRQKISLTLRRKLKRTAGAILINGQPADWRQPVHPGDNVVIHWPNECNILPLPQPLDIKYEDEFLLVVDKPAGLLVHPTADPAEPTLANAVVHHYLLHGIPCGFHPAHRLDRNTSGLVLIAKNPHIQHLLFSGGGKNLSRIYLALVAGSPAPPAGVIDAPIGRHPSSIIQRIVHPDGQLAVTFYETLQNIGEYSLVRLRLATGRTHQLRVHLAHIGHPILGDDLYGGSTTHIHRQALHAAELVFPHPVTQETISLASPLPPDMAELVGSLQPFYPTV